MLGQGAAREEASKTAFACAPPCTTRRAEDLWDILSAFPIWEEGISVYAAVMSAAEGGHFEVGTNHSSLVKQEITLCASLLMCGNPLNVPM